MMLVAGHHHNPTAELKSMLGRARNMSGGSTGSLESDLSRSWGSSTSSFDQLRIDPQHLGATISLHQQQQQQQNSINESSDHVSQSQSANKNIVNPVRYKTEMCRPFSETGHCKYGEKCQFAHGSQDLRGLPRHPKYKTELCRTFHTVGFCPYGPRCHFIHSEDEHKLVEITQMKQQQAAQQAAREMVQHAATLQAQKHAIQSQFSMLVSQVQTQIASQISHTNPTMYPQIPSVPVGHTSVSLPPTSLPLPVPFMLGSTADSPPESPIGSLSDDVFQSPTVHTISEMDFAPAFPAPVQMEQSSAGVSLGSLTSSLNGMLLENPTSVSAIPSTTTPVLPEARICTPPSSPESLCNSLDSCNRGSRLPVFSKLAGDS